MADANTFWRRGRDPLQPWTRFTAGGTLEAVAAVFPRSYVAQELDEWKKVQEYPKRGLEGVVMWSTEHGPRMVHQEMAIVMSVTVGHDMAELRTTHMYLTELAAYLKGEG